MVVDHALLSAVLSRTRLGINRSCICTLHTYAVLTLTSPLLLCTPVVAVADYSSWYHPCVVANRYSTCS